jgi:uncharacterized membrane protein YhaH (DUF805 family)
MTHSLTSDILAHLRRIATGMLDVTGRSSRSEFGIFLIILMAVNCVVIVVTETGAADFPAPLLRYLPYALWLPAISLFARRLHDQGRSGWLALILPVHLGLQVYGQMLHDAARVPHADLGFPVNVAEFVLVISFWLLVVWPGTSGENRFGPDPRKALAARLRKPAYRFRACPSDARLLQQRFVIASPRIAAKLSV